MNTDFFKYKNTYIDWNTDRINIFLCVSLLTFLSLCFYVVHGLTGCSHVDLLPKICLETGRNLSVVNTTFPFSLFPVKSTLLLHQSPTTGLFPTKTYGDNRKAKVHDSLYCAACAWALALAYRWVNSRLASLLCYILLGTTLGMF